jgi:hypothetical protein
MIRFWPRKPRFPVIIDTGVELVGAKTGAECSRFVARVGVSQKNISTPVIDTTAEGFGFYPQLMTVSALTMKKRWTKSEIIELYNSRRKPWAPEYRATSLGNKPVRKVVAEIVELLRLKPPDLGSMSNK